MKDLTARAVQKASSEAVFSALAYAALKARAGRIAPNQIIRMGEHELIVADDENGDGLVVQMILSRSQMENCFLAKVRDMDCSVDAWDDRQRREWLAGFWVELARYLSKWQDIRMRPGPGENVTFEKAVSR
jgi:hypothetical protein